MKLQLLDVFAKTAEDARVRTSSGGAVTLLAALVLSWLLVNQIRSYFTVVWDHGLVVDSSRGEKMTITLDMTFPNLPCNIISVDAMDDKDDVQENLDENLTMQDLGPDGLPVSSHILEAQRERREAAIASRGPDYEGPCWGADEGLRKAKNLRPDEPARCMTCDDVRLAYAHLGWQFHDGNGFSQCLEEGYTDALYANKENGCRVSGQIQVSKVVGRIHIAPGDGRFNEGSHSHDLSTFSLPDLPYDFAHKFNTFGFGDNSHFDSQLIGSPLENYEANPYEKSFQYRYFMKVVGTDFFYLNGTVVSTNQYSVTHHGRPLLGGRDADHPHSAHVKGGLPGIWINYDISPMKVTEKEGRELTFGGLVMNILAIIGAVITTAAVVDKGVYAVDQALKARKER